MTRTYRSSGSAVLFVFFGAAVLAVVAGSTIGDRRASIQEKLVFSTLALIFCAIWLLYARTAVRADERGILVVNVFKTRNFSWGEIEGFRMGTLGLQVNCGIVSLKDGTRFAMVGIRGWNPAFRPRGSPKAQQLIDRLTEDLHSAQSIT